MIIIILSLVNTFVLDFFDNKFCSQQILDNLMFDFSWNVDSLDSMSIAKPVAVNEIVWLLFIFHTNMVS